MLYARIKCLVIVYFHLKLLFDQVFWNSLIWQPVVANSAKVQSQVRLFLILLYCLDPGKTAFVQVNFAFGNRTLSPPTCCKNILQSRARTTRCLTRCLTGTPCKIKTSKLLLVPRWNTIRGPPFNLQGEGRDIFEINNFRQEDGKINTL